MTQTSKVTKFLHIIAIKTLLYEFVDEKKKISIPNKSYTRQLIDMKTLVSLMAHITLCIFDKE
jgi:hypothetical protein